MKTQYYCEKCDMYFSEEKMPNMNKTHRRCGGHARIAERIEEVRESEE